MRKWVSAAAILAALVYVDPVLGDNPAAVYSDFAEDGVLSCRHSRADLIATLNDASLHQYADQLTFARLKLAIRKQLAGGCRRPARTSGPTRKKAAASEAQRRARESEPRASESEPRASESKPRASESETRAKSRKASGKRVSRKPKKDAVTATTTASTGERSALKPEDTASATGGRSPGGLVLLGVLLLLLTLGSGGWAARRAFGQK